MSQRGFTLVEIMVAMVVIMALSTLALTAFNNSSLGKKKRVNGTVRADLNAVRARAQIYYDSTGAQNYGKSITACNAGIFSDPQVQGYVTEMTNILTPQVPTRCATDATGQFWSIAAPLYDGVTFWCVDSMGADRAGTVNTTTGLCQ